MASRSQIRTKKTTVPKSAVKGAGSARAGKMAPVKRSAKSVNAGKPGKYADIRRDLQRQRAVLLGEATEVISNRQDFEQFPDLSDQATAEVDQNFILRLKEREQKLIKKIDEALERISTGTYGICERCGGDIPYKRLKARPVTTLCIECKTQQELEEKMRK
jgi:DnaK suppressor protein